MSQQPIQQVKKNKEQEPQIEIDLEKAADSSVDLSVERTEFALERTQLAWVRTTLSMIGGGFIIDKAFAKFHEARVASGEALLKNAHAAGLVITTAGTLLMIMVTILYVKRWRELRQMRRRRKTLLAPGFLISAISIIIGVLLIYFITV